MTDRSTGLRHVPVLAGVLLLLLVLLPVHRPATAAADPSASAGQWASVAQRINDGLDAAGTAFHDGDQEGAKNRVKEARYSIYVGSGFEEALGAKSGADVKDADMDFALLVKAIRDNDGSEVDDRIDGLKGLMTSAAQTLDGSSQNVEDLSVSPGKWGQIATTMIGLLDRGRDASAAGDAEGGKSLVNEAYYGNYETTGFEKVTMSRVSGARVSVIELQFANIKKDMTDQDDDSVRTRIADLEVMLIQDANTLDGYDPSTGTSTGGSGGFTLFISAFLVILREGLEAILVVVAIIAFMIKAGLHRESRLVWAGVGLAVLISIGLALLFHFVTAAAGANQELLEGITALVAVAMLIWVSNWMIKNSDHASWTKYLPGSTENGISRGSLFSLVLVAFVAVLREGAETILFYQPILVMAGDDSHLVWLGLAVGAAALVVVYVLIRFFSVRIPLRPFFVVTSIFLAVMAVIFTGSGIKELQEAGVLPSTAIDGLPTFDLVGIYPRAENLIGQVVILIIIVALYVVGARRSRRRRAEAGGRDEQAATETTE
ncbi:FTR1 family protein [uncultured Propionibacterium sp.]|uniref:FTR1 family iron permease n=1 Tax=uncultured Propionibacterium sp. TaxID=218066 RepID=UPI0029317500|nr:FTR1 family protein [uncultured Propionibacterium sp.]